MAQVIADRRDVDFVLFEQFEVETLSQHELYADFNRKTIDMVVSEARNLAIKEIYPTQQEGDSGCTFDNGQVHVPECYRRAWEMYLEGEWLALTEDPEYGGQGMPRTVAMASSDYLVGANYAFAMYAGLTHGAALLVEAFGTEAIKKTLPQKNVHREMDRDHAADRTRGRIGRGPADHFGGEKR